MNLYSYINFDVGGILKQKMIDMVPGYRKYNKWKKRKALRRAGVYTDLGEKQEVSAAKLGDDWGDLQKSVESAVKDKSEAKALMKRLYHNKETMDDRKILKKLKI